jgi:DNA-directed RNA polymerase specialized sigma subunit
MDKNKIIEQYWLNDEVNQAFAKMQPEELQYDLKVEVFMVLLDMEDSKLFGLFERNEIRFYIVRTMLNMIKSDRSQFWKKYRNYTEYNGKEVAEVENNSVIDVMEQGIENLHWYQKEILRLYTFDFNKNAKELSRQTGIPYMSIIRTLKQTKNELKKHIRK